MADINLRQGYTSRYLITGKDPNGAPYDYTGKTIELLVKASTAATEAAMVFTLAVDGAGLATSTPDNRMFLGRPNVADLDGPLVDVSPSTGFITVRFAPQDSVDLVDIAAGTFVWEARAVLPDDAYYLDSGNLIIADSIFAPEVTP